MADKDSKNGQNVSGKYYVDNNCISCAQCADIAGDFFAESSDGGFYVKKQPGSADEIAMCEKAMLNCPVEAIGNDG